MNLVKFFWDFVITLPDQVVSCSAFGLSTSTLFTLMIVAYWHPTRRHLLYIEIENPSHNGTNLIRRRTLHPRHELEGLTPGCLR